MGTETAAHRKPPRAGGPETQAPVTGDAPGGGTRKKSKTRPPGRESENRKRTAVSGGGRHACHPEEPVGERKVRRTPRAGRCARDGRACAKCGVRRKMRTCAGGTGAEESPHGAGYGQGREGAEARRQSRECAELTAGLDRRRKPGGAPRNYKSRLTVAGQRAGSAGMRRTRTRIDRAAADAAMRRTSGRGRDGGTPDDRRCTDVTAVRRNGPQGRDGPKESGAGNRSGYG